MSFCNKVNKDLRTRNKDIFNAIESYFDASWLDDDVVVQESDEFLLLKQKLFEMIETEKRNSPFMHSELDTGVMLDGFALYLNREHGRTIFNHRLKDAPASVNKALVSYLDDLDKLQVKFLKQLDKIGKPSSLARPMTIAFALDNSMVFAKAMKSVMETGNDMIQEFSKEMSNLRNTHDNFDSHMTELFNLGKMKINKDSLMDGISIFLNEDMVEGNENKIKRYTVIDGEYSGGILRRIEVENGGKKRWIPLTDVYTDDGVDVSRFLQKKVKEKYKYEFLNELLEGEVREVVANTLDVVKENPAYYKKRVDYFLNLHNSFLKQYNRSPIMQKKKIVLGGHTFEMEYIFVEEEGFYKDNYDENGKIRGKRKYKHAKRHVAIPVSLYNKRSKKKYKLHGAKNLNEVISDLYPNILESESGAELNNVLFGAIEPGFYKATDDGSYNLGKGKGKVNTNRYTNHKRMENQPNMSLLSSQSIGDKEFIGMDKFAVGTKKELDGVMVKSMDLTKNQEALLKQAITDIDGTGLDNDFIEELKVGLNMRMQFYVDRSGEAQFLNGGMQMLELDYFPSMYDDFVLYDAHMEAVADLEQRILQVDEDKHPGQKKALQEELDYFSTMFDISQEGKAVAMEKKLKHGKRRQAWTPKRKRMKNSSVLPSYIEKFSNTIVYNNKAAQLVIDIKKLHDKFAEKDGERYRYMANLLLDQLKAETGRADIDAGVGRFVYSFARFTEAIQGVLPGVTEESVVEKVRQIGGFINGMLLGRPGAPLNNRGQIANPILEYGVDIYSSAMEALAPDANGNRDVNVQRMLELSGVTNVIETFNRALFKVGGRENYSESVIQTATGLPIKSGVKFAKLLFKSKKAFKEETLRGTSKDIVEFRNNLKKLFIDIGYQDARLEEQINHALDAYWEIQNLSETVPDKKKAEFIEKQFGIFYGKLQKAQFRDMVIFRLAYSPDPNDKAFNFKSSEETVREITAVMAVLNAARDKTLIGVKEKEGGIYDTKAAFTTATAIGIAREAVDIHAFTFSASSANRMMRGMGMSLFQFKNYPYNQYIHDMRMFTRLKAGSDDMTDMASRLWMIKGEVFKNESLLNSKDRDALVFARMLTLRTGVAMISQYTFIWKQLNKIPFFNEMVDTIIGGQLRGDLVRGVAGGLGNPVYTTVIRGLLAIPATAIEDDNEDAGDWFLSLLWYSILPVVLSVPLKGAYNLFTGD